MRLSEEIPTAISSIRAGNDRRREFPANDHLIEIAQESRADEVMLVDGRRVEVQEQRISDARVVARRQVDIKVPRPPQDR
jgi:hypothetical protein